MELMNPEVERLLAAKSARRRRLASLPFPDKVRAIVRMQEMAAPLLRARGRNARVWRIAPVSGTVDSPSAR